MTFIELVNAGTPAEYIRFGDATLATRPITRAMHDPGEEWPGIVREARILDGAGQRHASRVGAALLALLRLAFNDQMLAGGVYIHPTTAKALVMAAQAELIGCGGQRGLGGDGRGTDRAEWARGLGKGRARASDGPAYDAAIQDVADMIPTHFETKATAAWLEWLSLCDGSGEVNQCAAWAIRAARAADTPESAHEWADLLPRAVARGIAIGWQGPLVHECWGEWTSSCPTEMTEEAEEAE